MHVVHPASGGVGRPLTSPSPVPLTTTAASPIASSSNGVAGTAAPVASASSVSTSSCFPEPQATTGAPPAPQNFDLNENPQPWGSLMQCRYRQQRQAVVLYGYHIDDAVMPCTHFGLMLGTTDLSTEGTGGVTGVYGDERLSGSDLGLGMHAVSLSGRKPDQRVVPHRLLRRAGCLDFRPRERRCDSDDRGGLERESRRQVLVVGSVSGPTRPRLTRTRRTPRGTHCRSAPTPNPASADLSYVRPDSGNISPS